MAKFIGLPKKSKDESSPDLVTATKPPKKSSNNFIEWFLHGDVRGRRVQNEPEKDANKLVIPLVATSTFGNEAPEAVAVEKSSNNSTKNLMGRFQNGNAGSPQASKKIEKTDKLVVSGDTAPSEEELKETLKPSGLQAKLANALKSVNIQPKRREKIELMEFNVGELSYPSLDKPIKETNVTYPIDPPFQFVNIRFDGEELVYNVLEPPLSEGEKKYLAIIERSLEKLISSKIVAIRPEEREDFLRMRFSDIVRMYGFPLSEAHQDRMFYYLHKRYLGYDKIDIIMKDHYIEDISCNGPNNYMYIYHRVYGSVRTNVSFEEVELNKFVMRLAQISGRHISILQPIKDISMPDGSRANLTLGSEVTKKGATFTIRKFRDKPMSPVELMEYNSIDPLALSFLWLLLDYKKSILVSGGTASGKTTLLNVICSFIRPELKIVSLEDTAELNLVHSNWIQSVTRSGFGSEGGGTESVSGVSGISSKTPGDIGLYDLLVAALRQRPEYIIVGEVRGAEAFTMFQAIAVGHACLGTIHAGTMRELLSRIESNPMNVPRSLFSSLDAVCFNALIRRGERSVRRVMNIIEVLELDPNGDLITNPVFRWDAVTDKFIFTGKSHIFEKIENQLGVKEESLVREMEARAQFLLDLRQKNIRDYSAVVDKIHEYVLNQ
jgi:flagellar protein FlaI